MSMFFSDTQLGAFVFLLAMSGGLLLPSISVFGGVAGFVSFLEVVMILLPLFGCGFSFSSDGGNLLGAELLLECVFAATGLLLPFSFASTPPVHPQFLLIALGPGSRNLPADVLHLGPAAEPGRAPLAVAGLAIACWEWDTEPEFAFADIAADDGGGGANLTAVALLLAWTAAPPFLVSSPTLLREDVDMFSEDDDLFKSSSSNRLCDDKFGIGFLDLSMSIHKIGRAHV